MDFSPVAEKPAKTVSRRRSIIPFERRAIQSWQICAYYGVPDLNDTVRPQNGNQSSISQPTMNVKPESLPSKHTKRPRAVPSSSYAQTSSQTTMTTRSNIVNNNIVDPTVSTPPAKRNAKNRTKIIPIVRVVRK